MKTVKRALLGVMLAGWSLLGLASLASAQAPVDGPALTAPAEQSDWESRAVRRSRRSQASRSYYESAPRDRDDERAVRAGAWSPTRRVSYADQPNAPLSPIPAPLSPTPAPQETVQGRIERKAAAPERVVIGQEMISGMPMSGPSHIDGCECGQSGCPGGGERFCEDGCCEFGAGCGLFHNLSIMAGVHGFKGPLDNGVNGNFGLQEGLNFSTPVAGVLGDALREVGFQAGMLATQSNFHGDQTLGRLRTADRNQIFVTAALFKRAMCGGLQWGIAFDFLHDQYDTVIDMKQLRAELSWATACNSDIGFWGAFGTADARARNLDYEPIDMYNAFYRRYFDEGGEGRFWGGVTSNRDGIIGADLTVPLSRSWALENRFALLIPRNGTNAGGQAAEAYSLTVNLVWYPGRSARCEVDDQFRPMFPVADNTYFMMQRQQ